MYASVYTTKVTTDSSLYNLNPATHDTFIMIMQIRNIPTRLI